MLPMNDDFLKDVKLYVGVCVMISVGTCGPTAVLGACRKRRVFARQLEVKGMQLLPEVPIIRPFER